MDFKKIRFYIFAVLLLSVSLALVYILRVFAYPIFWAAVIAALAHPLYKKLQRRLKSNNLSTAITLIIVTIVILLPLSIIGTLMVTESLGLYETFVDNKGNIGNSAQQLVTALAHNPYLQRLDINDQIIADKIKEASTEIGKFIFTTVTSFTQDSFKFLLMFIIMLYTLFFFVRDGEFFLKKIMHLAPLGDKYEKILYDKFTSTARATIKGTIIVGIIQGVLGGIMFFIAGIQGVLIWGIAMAVLSIIPGPGAAIIWLPAAIILFILGFVWQPIFIILVGTLVIGTIDNVLRPALVGKDIQMPELLIFFSTLGGIVVFGASGFMIGPIIAAFFVALWQMYEHYYRNELNHNNG
jgi:predicted PurR-regulated permease PerM